MTPDALVRLHADLAYRVALRVTGTPDDAADATQAALVSIWRHGADIPADRQRAWVSRVARNAALDLVRRRRIRPQPLAADVDLDPVSPDPQPDAHAEAGDLRREIGAALDTLGEPFRSLVVLRDVEGLSYDEIADALTLPLTTVKVYLHRARARLRAALQTSVPDLVP
jgi:RNA polymerase sigma-70 factor (ECF subfamily)